MPADAPKADRPARSEPTSFLGETLRVVTRLSSHQPKTTLWCCLLLSVASVAFTVCMLRFKTDRADLIDPDAPFHRRWIRYTESFGDASELVVVVEADSSEQIKQVLDDLGGRLRQEPELFRDVLYKIEPGAIRGKGLQFLSAPELEAGLERLAGYGPVLNGRWELLRLDSLAQRLGQQLEARTASTANEPPRNIQPLVEHADSLAVSLLRFAENRGDFVTPWPDLVPVDPRMREQARGPNYLLNRSGTMGFLKALPVAGGDDFHGPTKAIDRLRQLVAEVSAQHAGARIGVTGIPVLESDEMRRSQSDMLVASLISAAGVGLLLIVGFRGFRHPMLALAMLGVGMAWAFGYTTIAIGHLNILSVSFAVILIGLGIDFGIHYLARYLELRQEGLPLEAALLESSASVGTGIVTAAVTTAMAFFCATLTQFLGVAELGVIAGGGILLCAVATFVVLPALIALSDRNSDPAGLPKPLAGGALRSLSSRFPLITLALSALLMIGLGANAFDLTDGVVTSRVDYDYNLLNLQAAELDSVEVQKRVFQQAGDSLLYAVSLADTAEAARELHAKFAALPSVHHVEDLASRLPAVSPEQTRLLVQAYRAQLARLPHEAPPPGMVNPASVGRALEGLHSRVSALTDADAVEAARALDRFLDWFDQLSLQAQMRFLQEYQTGMATALLRQLQGLAEASNSDPVTLADLPTELTSRFVSAQGQWLVQVYPAEQIWDIGPLERFVNEVRSVDPHATGTPLQNYEASQQIIRSYEKAALYALAVTCFVLMVDFLNRDHKLATLLPPLAIIAFLMMTLETRGQQASPVFLVGTYIAMVVAIAAVVDFNNLRDTVLALLPPLAGGAMMFGLLGLLGVDLNPANLIALPLVLGIGVDDGVHVIHDFRHQKTGYRISTSTMNAIVLTSLTSMIGFGSLMLAAHRGLYSVGLVLVIGIASCLFVSLVPLPAVLTLLSRRAESVAAADANPAENARSPEKRGGRAA